MAHGKRAVLSRLADGGRARVAPSEDLEAMIVVQAQVIAAQVLTGLRARVADLEQANARLVQANQVLAARVEELERRLGRDSSNSSRPPSSDGLGKSATPGRERRAGGRKPGKQPGAPGAHLVRVGDPDEVVVHRPVTCQGCGADLTLAPVCGVEARQVFDLPRVRLVVIEHQAEQRQCGCGRVTAASFPGQARAAACFGPGVRALGSYLGAWQYLHVQRAAELLGDVLGAPVSAGWLAGLAAEGAGGLAEFAETVRELLRAEPVAHFDETGARVAGRLHWVHSASTGQLSWFAVHAKRGANAMDAAGVLPGFRGVAVHDCWSPYWRYDKATHALCAAHLLRELDEAAGQPGQGWAGELSEWLSMACGQAAQAREVGAERLGEAVVAGLLGRYQEILAKGHAANPPPRPARRGGRPKRTAAACLLDRLDIHRDEVCRFLEDLRVPPTNNQAERDIRMVKLVQKISGCWRTLPGAQAFLTVRSYVSTARKQGVNPLAALRQLFEGHPWLPAPSPS